jgi:hypothetical protein
MGPGSRAALDPLTPSRQRREQRGQHLPCLVRVRQAEWASSDWHTTRNGRRWRLPVIDVQYVGQRTARGGAERIAGVVGDRD